MSDPRASITRTVLAPPMQTVSASRTELSTSRDVENVRLIGKPHGRMRCVNLSLTTDAKDVLHLRASADGLTLGEALMDLLALAAVPALPRRADRGAGMRRGVRTASTYVLLTPGEAASVSSSAMASGRSVSDYVSHALSSHPGR